MKYTQISNWLGILITVGLICFSCSDESPIDEPIDEGGKKPTTETGYFSVNTIRGRLQTKAAAEDEGSIDEYFVESVRIVLYDGTDGLTDNQCKVKYAFDFDIKSNEQLNPSIPWINGSDTDLYVNGSLGSQSFITYARKVEKQDYLMLVIINPTLAGSNNDTHPSIIEVTQAGNTPGTLSNLKEAVSISPQNLRNKQNGGVAAGRYFLMTNHKELVKVTADELKATVEDAHLSPIKVNVDRVVAKVYVNLAADFKVIPDDALIDNITWELDITNKKTFWMRKMDKQRGGINIENINTGRNDIYATDPNFTGYSGSDKTNLRKDHFNVVYTADHNTDFENKPNDFQYALENTMAENEQGDKDVTTRVVIRAQYAPSGFSLNDSYYVFTNDTGANYFIAPEKMALYATTANNSIPEAYSGLKEDIEEASKVYDLVNPTASFKSGGIRFFYQGYCYYQIPIKHFGGDEVSIGYGYYGVVRNNIYTISLKSITGPGGLTLEESTFLSAGVNIVPWGKLEEGWDIGETTYSFVTYNYFYAHLNAGDPFLGSDIRYLAVGSPYPTMTDSIRNAYYEKIVQVGWPIEYLPGVVTPPEGNTVSADCSQNIFTIFYPIRPH